MSDFILFSICALIIPIIQLIADYYMFGMKRSFLKKGTIWENIDKKDPFFQQRAKILNIDRFQIHIEFISKKCTKWIEVEEFVKTYKLID